MNIGDILKLDFDKALEVLTADPKEKDKGIADNRKAFRGEHAILDDPDRATKTVGATAATQRVVKLTSETIPFQRRIVNSAVTFLFGEPVSLVLNNDAQDAFGLINAVWKKNKLNYFNKRLARDLFIECKAAELWYVPPKDKGKPARIRVTLLSNREGYAFYPHFDEFGDMDAFTVKYEIKGPDGKPQDTVNIYTADKIIRAVKAGGMWTQKPGENILGKIPVVYYEQDEPEWDGVDTQIERLEYLMSNFADTNDYNGSPLTQVKGVVSNMPKKEETGKVVTVAAETNPNTGEVTYPGGVEFVSWEQAPESIKLEMEALKDIIYAMTQTPDLSFSNVKGMSAVSGIALRLMFSDALFKARDKQEIFGPAMERRLSIMKSIIALANVGKRQQIEEADIDVLFGDVVPTDIEALIKSLSTARGGEAIMSEESAVRMNPLVTDAEKDIEVLAGEKTALKSFADSYA